MRSRKEILDDVQAFATDCEADGIPIPEALTEAVNYLKTPPSVWIVELTLEYQGETPVTVLDNEKQATELQQYLQAHVDNNRAKWIVESDLLHLADDWLKERNITPVTFSYKQVSRN